MSHTGRPQLRDHGRVGISVLCPLGHYVTWLQRADWAGSQWEAKLGDPEFTVTCDGTVRGVTA